MRLRTLGAVCVSCAAAVPTSSAAASQRDILASAAPANITDVHKRTLIERQIRLQRVHHRLHGDHFTRVERISGRTALAALSPRELRARSRELRVHIAQLRRRDARRRHGGAPDVPIPKVLDGIASCESHGNPRAVSAGGTYRGKYQFDYHTWASVGGKGDPTDASETEQDRRAALLYKRAGSTPWPVCGSSS